ncbi:MAG: hypothetical protein HGA36_02640 [Candidatus Moranbacteria bacterium]|nr:hypothetical protein [Candidatus Moranbacteria bacterium]
MQTNDIQTVNETVPVPKIARSLYKKTLRALRAKKHGFYEAANAAIASEIASHEHLGKKIKQERGMIIYSLGSMLIGRHPQLIV